MHLSGYQYTKDFLTGGLYTRFQQNVASHTIFIPPSILSMSKLSGLRELVEQVLVVLHVVGEERRGRADHQDVIPRSPQASKSWNQIELKKGGQGLLLVATSRVSLWMIITFQHVNFSQIDRN